jgi:hypothetical protein
MTTTKVEEIVNKILSSNEFSGGESYHKLLKYLVDKSINNISPKESSIAIEVFEKDINDNNFDSSIVRVYMHNLRQKLDSYYQHEGRDDDVQLKIPKGHYLVKFDKKTVRAPRDLARILIISNIITLSIILIGIILFMINYSSILSPQVENYGSSLMWNNYISDDRPILLVFGDYYLYEDRSLSRIRYVRDFKINSDDELRILLNQQPGSDELYRITEHTLLGKFALTCLVDLFKFFSQYDRNLDVKLGSNLQWEDLNRNNIIFIGSFKTLRLLKNLLEEHHFRYLVHPNTLIFTDVEKDTSYHYQAPRDHITGQVIDYAIVSRFPGPSKNIITLFSSTHDVGHISTVRQFTNPAMLEEFEKTNLNFEKPLRFFDALFEVEGFSRTGFHPKLLHIAELDTTS